MAQNITLLGSSYSNVPSVRLPKTGGGTATFDDTTISSNAAAASDIASGKLAYVNGALITGTNSEVQPKVMHSFSVPTSSSIEINISGTSEASFLLSAFGWFSGFRALYYCAGYMSGSRSTANGIVTDSRIAIDFASYTGSFRFKITNSATVNAIIKIMSFDPNTVFTQV